MNCKHRNHVRTKKKIKGKRRKKSEVFIIFSFTQHNEFVFA